MTGTTYIDIKTVTPFYTIYNPGKYLFSTKIRHKWKVAVC